MSMAPTPLSVLPLPRTPDPYEAPALRWGVLGPGWIAQRFVESLQANRGQHVLAVGSRDQSRASAFAAQWSLAKAYDSYEALFDDPDIDIVYIATTRPSQQLHLQRDGAPAPPQHRTRRTERGQARAGREAARNGRRGRTRHRRR